ncbi:MAG TPA: hypothetical protein VE571_08835, partial [Solirubrobacteraceae bacterium]|nr:hypothetical protein [Solirubrobacteraceae bacterium]
MADARPGQKVLVHGASGGVGNVLLQLARHARIDVIGTGSPRSHDILRDLGAQPLDYRDLAIGADDDGRFTALIHTGISAMTPYNALAEQFTFPARHIYATQTLKTDQQVVDMDMLANSFMRAPG